MECKPFSARSRKRGKLPVYDSALTFAAVPAKLRATDVTIHYWIERSARPGPDRAMVFQQASLLPRRIVLGTVVYGLELLGRASRRERNDRAREFIRLVGLEGFEEAFATGLSGG